MTLTRLKLRNFRNISNADMTPGRGFNILWGCNAQGKTNALEAIYLLGHFKSFRRGGNDELIGPDHAHADLRGEYASASGMAGTMALAITRNKKTVRVDGKTPRHGGELFGRFPSVLFAPEEISRIKGFPAGRRSLIDRALVQTMPSFLELARNYQRCLKQRNTLLKEDHNPTALQAWTEELIRTGAEVRILRQRYLARLVPLLRKTYDHITAGKETADVHYPAESDSLPALREQLREDLKREHHRERRFGMTLIGPHRDDPVFLVNDRKLNLYGSQGQQRSFVLAFKTAQIQDLEAITGIRPLLLLDDMTSELDRDRQGFFFEFLQNRQGQVFITTTDLELLPEADFRDVRIYRVEKGVLQPV
jgi:DNA replication and repair protein RecF